MVEQQYAEYAIHVQDVGPVGGAQRAPYKATVGADKPDIYLDETEAQANAQKVIADYQRLGQPDIAAKVGIHVRMVTTIYEEWTPLATTPAA